MINYESKLDNESKMPGYVTAACGQAKFRDDKPIIGAVTSDNAGTLYSRQASLSYGYRHSIEVFTGRCNQVDFAASGLIGTTVAYSILRTPY